MTSAMYFGSKFLVWNQILSSSFEIKRTGGHFEVQNRTLKFLHGSLRNVIIRAYIKAESIPQDEVLRDLRDNRDGSQGLKEQILFN